ncbi:MAG: pilus assembly protein [Desulfuromonadales bacterium]|nr:pilus assembly protein [Desulfuromonadales bacterium]
MKRIRFQEERGATTVEFALVSILLLSIIFGIIELGVLTYDKHVLTNASREGARAGVVLRLPRLTDEDIEDIVKQYSQEHMITFGVSSAVAMEPVLPLEPRVGSLFGTDLVVKVTYQFDFLVLSMFGLGPIPLTAETHMRME